MTSKPIRPRERDAILQSLRAGVTPKTGVQHIQVGRVREIEAQHNNINRIADGGAAFSLVIGDYGSGKTFFMSLVRSMGLQKNLVSSHADLSPDRRIQASAGQARNLYAELMRNIATRNKPEGNALVSIVERFITESRRTADASGIDVDRVIQDKLLALSDMVGGYDFAAVIRQYLHAHDAGNEQLMGHAVRWLRGEYATRTDARRDLGVRTIIDDQSFYDSLKLMALFVRQAGYKGLLINLDEMVNLYKLSNTQARTANYEQVLRMLNDCLQGGVEGLGFMLGGTPEFLLDPRRGLYSYDALKSRLEQNSFAQQMGVQDYSSPVLHLAKLTPEELYILLKNLRHVFASGDPAAYLVPDQALEAFLAHCHQTVGADYFRTPRSIIRAFLDMLTVLDQNPSIEWHDMINKVTLEADLPSDIPEIVDTDSAQGTSQTSTGTLAGFQI